MENRRHITERILDLTLEIIFLLTGEECIITKKTSGNLVMLNSVIHVSQGCNRKQSSRIEVPNHALMSDKNNDQKILEVIQKIVELLTGEVPIRCQDVSVYFSTEEWEYLEGHKDLYKDVLMEDQPSLTSPDGSSIRNTPERCPCPLDSTEEHQKIPQDGQGEYVSIVKVTRKEEEETCVNTINIQRKENQVPTVVSVSKNTQRCLNPFSSQSFLQIHHKDSNSNQRECLLNVKVKEKGRARDKFLRNNTQKKHGRQLSAKLKVREKEENKKIGVQKEKCEHLLPSEAEDRIDADKESECQLKIKEKKERILRMNVEKEKHEQPLTINTEVADKCLGTDIQMNKRTLNLTTENTECQENLFLRTDLLKKERDVPQRSNSIDTPKCPNASPPNHWDSTGEHHKVLQNDKGKHLLNIKVEDMDSDNERYVWRDVRRKDEDVSTDESNNRNTPERSQSPLYPWDSTLENHKIFPIYQEERLSQRQAGGRAAPEIKYGRGAEQLKDKKIPSEIGSDGRYMGYNTEKSLLFFPDGDMEDDATGDSLEGTPTDAHLYTIPHSVGQSPSPFVDGGTLRGLFPPIPHRASRTRGETFMCSECGECFTAKAKLFKHQRDHIVDKPHSCPDCGKCFVEKSHLVNHQRSHSVERPYSCSVCGKSFGEKGHLANHEKSHANEKEFFCYECGKCFTQRGHFNRHQRLHTGEKPYPCPQCGKCFPHKEYLIRHQRVHAGQKPFPCFECGKCFTDKYDLAKHERIHSGHRPYTCLECGRGFTQKSNLARHVRVHAEYNRVHVMTVENGSPGNPPSSTISAPREDERFLYQDMVAD